MSRTYRAFDKKGKEYFNKRNRWSDWFIDDKSFVRWYYGEKRAGWSGPWKTIKDETNRKDRAWTRKKISEVKKLEDFEDFDYNYHKIKGLRGDAEWGYI